MKVGWSKTNFNTYRQKTFAINVPTKFLQHYQITNWETTTAADGQIYGTIKLANGAEKWPLLKQMLIRQEALR